MKKAGAAALIGVAVGASVLIGAGGAQAALIDETVYSGSTATVTFQNDLGTEIYVILGYNESGEAGLLVTESPWAAGETRTITFFCEDDGTWMYPTPDGQSAPVTSFEILEDNDGELVFNPAVVLDPNRCGEETPGEETPGEETPGEETPGEETPGEEEPGAEVPGSEVPIDVTPGQETPVVDDVAEPMPVTAADVAPADRLADTGPSEHTPVWFASGIVLVAAGALLAMRDRRRRLLR